ncbi:MAG: caspase family protein [Fulvivirga sp.]
MSIKTILFFLLGTISVGAQQISISPVGKLQAQLDRVTAIGMSAAADKLVAGDRKGNLTLWDLETLSQKGTTSIKDDVLFIEFLKGDNEILVVDVDGNLNFFNPQNLSLLRSGNLPGEATHLSIDPEKKSLSCINKDGQLRIFNLTANMLQTSIDIEDRIDDVLYLGYDRFGQQIAVMSDDGTTLTCNPVNQKVIREAKLRSNEFSGSASVMHAAASNKGSDLFVTGVQEVFIPKGGIRGGQPERRNSILAYDWDTSNEIKRIRINNRVDQIALGPGPTNMTYFTRKRFEVTVVDIEQGAEVAQITLDEFPETLTISEDDSYLAVGDAEGTVHLFLLEKNAAPQIKIIKPSLKRNYGESIIEHPETEIHGALSDGAKIKSISVNGEPAQIQPDGRFTTNVPLVPGKNKVRIVAEDYQSNTVFKDIYVTRKPDLPAVDKNKSIATSGQSRKALVIGNAEYEGTGALVNTVNDAKVMSETLKNLGFDVQTILDGSYEDMKNAVYAFGDAIRDVDVTIFYYAGHGLEIEGVNYLIPVDAHLNSVLDVKQKAVPLTGILRTMNYANENGLNMIILDACRNNPFPTGKRGGAGLAKETPPSGTLIAYSTSPGNVASDGEGENGLYTGELIKQLNKQQRIEDVFMNTRINVESLSNGDQQPWEEARLKGVFYLKF